MRRWRLVLTILVLVCSPVGVSVGKAVPEKGFKIHGYMYVSPNSKYSRSFKAKLSFPKGEQELFASPNSDNVFTFSGLPAQSYLLEVFVKDALYYQKEIANMESDVLLAIPMGEYKLATQLTIAEKKNQAMRIPGSQEALTISVGDIKSDLKPDQVTSNGFRLKVLQGNKTINRETWLIPPKLITTFTISNTTYTLAGAVRKSGKTEFIDCEIYQ